MGLGGEGEGGAGSEVAPPRLVGSRAGYLQKFFGVQRPVVGGFGHSLGSATPPGPPIVHPFVQIVLGPSASQRLKTPVQAGSAPPAFLHGVPKPPASASVPESICSFPASAAPPELLPLPEPLLAPLDPEPLPLPLLDASVPLLDPELLPDPEEVTPLPDPDPLPSLVPDEVPLDVPGLVGAPESDEEHAARSPVARTADERATRRDVFMERVHEQGPCRIRGTRASEKAESICRRVSLVSYLGNKRLDRPRLGDGRVEPRCEARETWRNVRGAARAGPTCSSPSCCTPSGCSRRLRSGSSR